MTGIGGILLAGGLARRMRGVDKALAPLAGQSLLAHCRARLVPQCVALVLNANGDAARFAASGIPVVADSVPDFAGPLAGILAGLDYFAQAHPAITHAVSAPCDTPFLPRDLVARLDAAVSSAQADLAVTSSGGRAHHAVALWPIAMRDALRTALTQDGERSVGRFAARYRNAHADWPTTPFDPFFNVNTPDDLAIAEEILRHHPAQAGSRA